MSVQVFLQGELLGHEAFLLAGARRDEEDDRTLTSGRAYWISLFSEVLPRALLAELGLSRILLGTSGGGRFLLVLPSEAVDGASELLRAAAAAVQELTGGTVRLLWAYTENLGDWSDIRKRLNEGLTRLRVAPAADQEPDLFAPFQPAPAEDHEDYFRMEVFANHREAAAVYWSSEAPARISFAEGKHSWPLGGQVGSDGPIVARHLALAEDGHSPATLAMLAAQSEGAPLWGVLRGRVDDFAIRLRRAGTVEEHIQISILYKQFFAGELEVACSMPEFWRRVSVLYAGGDDFAVYGSWDALVQLARELQRLFHRFSEEYLREFPGPEGKTLSMGLAVSGEQPESLTSLYQIAGRGLDTVQSSGKGSIRLFGRTLEWKQLNDAADLKDQLLRLIVDFGCSLRLISLLGDFYRGGERASSRAIRARLTRVERPWRFHQRLRSLMEGPRDREFQKLRTTLINEFMRKNAPHVKLRPAGRVALAWAKLLAEGKANA